VQEHANRAVNSAREISDRITAEARSFAEFMQKANDTEKSALRLEVEKLRRSENQWLQILVHLLDHVYALYQAGVRSGQPNLQAQLGQFQDACRDIARRVGLTPFEAEANEPFDAEKHQVADGQPPAAPEALVAHTLATGYTFQGQLLRHSLVALHNPDAESAHSSFVDTSPESAAAPESLLGTDGNSEIETALMSADEESNSSFDEPANTDTADNSGNDVLLPDASANDELGSEFVVMGEGPSSGPSAGPTTPKSTPQPFRLESEVLPSDEENRRP